MVFGRAGPVRARGIPVPRRAAWARWLRDAPSALVPLAVAVGAVTGLGAVGFRWLITAFTRMFTGYTDYSGLGRVRQRTLAVAGLLVPAAGPGHRRARSTGRWCIGSPRRRAVTACRR